MASGSLEQAIAQVQLYWRMVVKYNWHILIGTLAMLLLFTVILARLPNIYEATTTILVNPQQVPERYVSPAVTSDPYSRLNTITQQVLSRSRLQEIIDRFNLYSGFGKALSEEEMIEQMRNDISVHVKQGSGPELSTFTLTYQGKEPALVAQVANELAASFIRWNLNSRQLQVTGTQDFLTSELESAKKSLQYQEDKLKRFKMSHLGETPDQTLSNVQALASLRSALDANADAMNRLDEQRLLLTHLTGSTFVSASSGASSDSGLTDRNRLELEKHQVETDLRDQMQQQHSERYPDVVRATRRLQEIDDQLRSLPAPVVDHRSGTRGEAADITARLELIDREIKRRQNEQNQIESHIASYQRKVEAAPLREQQFVELTRNYDISRQHYQSLLDGTFNIGMAADLEQKQKAERFTVLDLAQAPQKPVKPKRKLLIPASGLVAFGLSIFGVLVRDSLSSAVKTEMELKSLLPKGARIMGIIPHIETTAETRRRRRMAIYASVVCVLLCLALTSVIWGIRQNL
jgi:polysaccharide biosynthesis transport protein